MTSFFSLDMTSGQRKDTQWRVSIWFHHRRSLWDVELMNKYKFWVKNWDSWKTSDTKTPTEMIKVVFYLSSFYSYQSVMSLSCIMWSYSDDSDFVARQDSFIWGFESLCCTIKWSLTALTVIFLQLFFCEEASKRSKVSFGATNKSCWHISTNLRRSNDLLVPK